MKRIKKYLWAVPHTILALLTFFELSRNLRRILRSNVDLLAAEPVVLLRSLVPLFQLSELLLGNQLETKNLSFPHWCMYYGYKKKLTKVDSCRLLFFLCFLCFFPSSPSSFPPWCPFRGAACGKRPVNILRTTSSAFHQTTDQSKPAFVQVSRLVQQFGMMMMASQQWNDTLLAMAS